MKVSLNQTTSPNVRDTNGYGYAGKMCKTSLEALGHEVTWRDPTADVEINFIQPEHWHWTGPHRIAYLPWESTLLHHGWVDKLNEVDEVWTPSPIIAGWMKDEGVTKDIRVYEHGVDPVWHEGAQKRSGEGTFEVLHTGAEALRKGGNETIHTFMAALGEKDARLTMKMILNQFSIHDTATLRVFRDRMAFDDLVKLFQTSDLLCYPSWGEGFGLNPLQAMASAMPVLITKGWAPYEDFLEESNLVNSTLVESPWPHIHPGKMLQPDLDDLHDKLLYHFENRPDEAQRAWNRALPVMQQYDWLTLTEEAFAHLK